MMRRAGVALARHAMFALAALAAIAGTACRDSGSTASAADPPRIEVKAAVAPISTALISAPMDGRIDRIHVAEGAAVKRGDLLVTIHSPSLDRDLAYARAQVAAAEARMRAAGKVRNVPAGEGERVAADLLRNKEQKLARYRGLYANGDISKQELLDVEAEHSAARAAWLAQREARVAQAGSGADPALLQAELERARAEAAYVQQREVKTRVVASADGTVAQIRVREGDEVYPRDPLLDIADRSSMRVQAQIAPEVMRFVRVGQAVDVRVMSIPPRRFREPISRVAEPGTEGGPAIFVNVPNPDRMMQPGTPAVITLQ